MLGRIWFLMNQAGDPPPGNTPSPALAPAPPPAPPPGDLNPPWLPERLSRAEEQGRQKFLAELGVTDTEKAKAAIAAAAKAEEDAKSTGQKLGEVSKEREAFKSEADRLRAVTTEWAARQMMALTADQQKAVKDIAGDDAAAQLKAITALTPTWAQQTPPAPPAGAPPAPKPPAQPAPPASGTAPPPHAPVGADLSQVNHREVHTSLQKTNPFEAADYALAHVREVYPEQSS